MKEKVVKGKYSKASVFASIVEKEALSQIKEICNQPFSKDSNIAIMPDVHSGKGCTIGFTMTLKDKVCPNLVGVDIGCGMMVVELGNIEIDFKKLDDVIRTYIPSGRDCRSTENIEELRNSPEYKESIFEPLETILSSLRANISKPYELIRIGTLGSGNHFIEIDEDSEGNKYLVIHTGSRHLGVEVCNYYMEKANESCVGSLHQRDLKIREMIAKFKEEGRQREIEAEKNRILSTFKISESNDLAYVEGDNYQNYIEDMKLSQKYASLNRELIASLICSHMGWKAIKTWTTMHNYIDLDKNILRKGAISLDKGEKALIPLSMKEGALIVIGKGNPNYNYSGPHGAGRLMSRAMARKAISLEDFEKSMEGIYTTCVNKDTIDESPFAYKRKEDILPMLEDTAEIIKQIKPLYNFKASDTIENVSI